MAGAVAFLARVWAVASAAWPADVGAGTTIAVVGSLASGGRIAQPLVIVVWGADRSMSPRFIGRDRDRKPFNSVTRDNRAYRGHCALGRCAACSALMRQPRNPSAKPTTRESSGWCMQYCPCALSAAMRCALFETRAADPNNAESRSGVNDIRHPCPRGRDLTAAAVQAARLALKRLVIEGWRGRSLRSCC